MKLTNIFESIIAESSISRVWQHINDGKTFAVISAFRGSNDPKENLNLHNKLKSDVRALGLGFIEQKSGYTYQNPDSGEEGTVDEMSLFIPNIDEKSALKLGKKYKQESILFKNQNQFILLNCDTGSVDMKFAKSTNGSLTFKPDVLKYAFSQLIKGNKNSQKKYAFVAESINVYELLPPNRTESILSMKSGELAKAKWVKIV
jgi:hypothetical protein